MNLKISSNDYKQTFNLEGGSLLVLLDRLGKEKDYGNEECAKNLYLISSSGDIIWQVTSNFDGDGGAFTHFEFRDAKLFGYRWDGCEYKISLMTGFATPCTFLR